MIIVFSNLEIIDDLREINFNRVLEIENWENWVKKKMGGKYFKRERIENFLKNFRC